MATVATPEVLVAGQEARAPCRVAVLERVTEELAERGRRVLPPQPLGGLEQPPEARAEAAEQLVERGPVAPVA